MNYRNVLSLFANASRLRGLPFEKVGFPSGYFKEDIRISAYGSEASKIYVSPKGFSVSCISSYEPFRGFGVVWNTQDRDYDFDSTTNYRRFNEAVTSFESVFNGLLANFRSVAKVLGAVSVSLRYTGVTSQLCAVMPDETFYLFGSPNALGGAWAGLYNRGGSLAEDLSQDYFQAINDIPALKSEDYSQGVAHPTGSRVVPVSEFTIENPKKVNKEENARFSSIPAEIVSLEKSGKLLQSLLTLRGELLDYASKVDSTFKNRGVMYGYPEPEFNSVTISCFDGTVPHLRYSLNCSRFSFSLLNSGWSGTLRIKVSRYSPASFTFDNKKSEISFEKFGSAVLSAKTKGFSLAGVNLDGFAEFSLDKNGLVMTVRLEDKETVWYSVSLSPDGKSASLKLGN